MMMGDTEPLSERHALRNTQRRLKMDAILGAVKEDQMRTPSPVRKSILSRTHGYNGKENIPGTPPSHGSMTTPPCRLASVSEVATPPGTPRTRFHDRPLSPTKTTPLLSDEAKDSLRYTSLSELVITIPCSSSESFGTSSSSALPRTPMKDALVEKAVKAYLGTSESFNRRNRRGNGWGMCLVIHDFLPSFMTKFSLAVPNPVQFFCCALHAFRMYMKRASTPLLPFYLIRSDRSESAESDPTS